MLGIKPTAPGAETVQISPQLSGLSWARGTVATVRGPINVSWKLTGDALHFRCTAPKDVRVKFVKNASLEGKHVLLNGKPVE